MKRVVSFLRKAASITGAIVFCGVFFVGILPGVAHLYYSDWWLYSFEKNYIIKDVGLERFNKEEEVNGVLSSGFTNTLYLSKGGYRPPSETCLGKMTREFPSRSFWKLIKYEGHKAMVMQFGNYFNRAWLVAVDPSEHIRCDGDNVRRIADNIAVVHDFNKIDPPEDGCDDSHPEEVQ